MGGALDGDWFTERLYDAVGYSLRVERRLHEERTPFQRIELFESAAHGKVLALDGYVMLTERDVFVYHEMLAHVALQTLERPARAVIVGGGDGGLAAEMLKYPGLEVTQAEIDARVVAVCREHLPGARAALDDPRVTVLCRDGAEHLAELPPGSVDLIAVDSTDPIGPAEALISREFYATAARALADGGVLVAQTQSPLYHPEEMRRLYGNLRAVFPGVWTYWAVCPSYLGALWTFAYAARTRHPLRDLDAAPDLATRYYTPEVHRAAFALPPFVREVVGGEPP